MRFLELPWLEFSIATTLIGSLWVSQIREPYRAARMGLVFTGIAFVFAFLAWLGYYVGVDTDSISRASLEPYIFGREVSRSGRAQRAAGAGRRPAALPDCPGHGADQDEKVLVFLVAGLGGDPPGDVQLQGVVAAGRPAGGLHRSALLRAQEPRPADAGVRAAHGAFRGADGRGVGGGRIQRRPVRAADLGHGSVDGGHPRPLRHRAGPLLGDGLVRAYIVRHRPAVRDSSGRRLRGRPSGLADRARLGAPEHRSGLAGHGRLRGGHGGDPAATVAASSPTCS